MSLPHYFLDEQIISQEQEPVFTLLLASDDAHHAKVARLGIGEHIAVVDASQDYFECEVVAYDGALPQVRVARKLDGRLARPLVTLVQGITKAEKFELVLRHATELGVDEFIPYKAQRSVVKIDDKKLGSRMDRWNTICKSAAMQSGQQRIPTLQEPQSLKQLSSCLASYDVVLVCWEEAAISLRLSAALAQWKTTMEPDACAQARIAVVVGPEGGLAQAEVDALLNCGTTAKLVSLGSSILRTETAGLIAPALVLYELGELGGHALEGPVS